MRPKTEDYGPRLNITIWSLTSVAALFLGLRVYCKVIRGREIRWDDSVLIASWLALATSCSFLSVAVIIGYGRHNEDITPENFNHVLLVSYIAGFFSILAACWSKISFAITLLRIVTQRRVKKLLWAIIWSVNIVLGANATFQFAQCWPPERLWHPGGEGKCWPRTVMIYYNTFAAAYSGLTDITLALLPWMIVWTATISKREKLSALFAMSMGVFAGITTFLKINTIWAIGSKDMIDSVNLLIFGTAESAITIIAVSIPILRALVYVSKTPPEPRFFKELEIEEVGIDDYHQHRAREAVTSFPPNLNDVELGTSKHSSTNSTYALEGVLGTSQHSSTHSMFALEGREVQRNSRQQR